MSVTIGGKRAGFDFERNLSLSVGILKHIVIFVTDSNVQYIISLKRHFGVPIYKSNVGVLKCTLWIRE